MLSKRAAFLGLVAATATAVLLADPATAQSVPGAGQTRAVAVSSGTSAGVAERPAPEMISMGRRHRRHRFRRHWRFHRRHFHRRRFHRRRHRRFYYFSPSSSSHHRGSSSSGSRNTNTNANINRITIRNENVNINDN